MELKPGYKRSEVGVIPEDWDIDYIEDVALVATGSKNTQDRIEDGQYPFFVRSQTVERINSYSFDGEAVLTAGDGVGTGKVVHYVNGRFDVHQRVYRISNFSERVDGYFFYLYFSTHFYNRIMQMTAKSSVDSVRRDMITRMLVPIPPTDAEQRAIATALSDVDALLRGLDRLIAKKRDLKQAAMQQLLTGQTRLPGFSGEWETKQLGDLLAYERPDRYIVKSTEYSNRGDIPVLTANKAFILGYTTEAFGVCADLPAIVFDDFTTDSKFATAPFKVKSSAIKILRPRCDRTSLRFLFDRMQLIRFPVGDHKRYYISDYQNIRLPIPESDEQLAVVSVLSVMDAEITALEARRNKTSALKQAMMQELLTGKTRLVAVGGAPA